MQIKDLQAAKAKAPFKTVQEVENQIKCVSRACTAALHLALTGVCVARNPGPSSARSSPAR